MCLLLRVRQTHTRQKVLPKDHHITDPLNVIVAEEAVFHLSRDSAKALCHKFMRLLERSAQFRSDQISD